MGFIIEEVGIDGGEDGIVVSMGTVMIGEVNGRVLGFCH